MHGLHSLDGADVRAFEENALTVWLVDDGKAIASGIDARVILDKGMLGDAEKAGDHRDF